MFSENLPKVFCPGEEQYASFRRFDEAWLWYRASVVIREMRGCESNNEGEVKMVINHVSSSVRIVKKKRKKKKEPRTQNDQTKIENQKNENEGGYAKKLGDAVDAVDAGMRAAESWAVGRGFHRNVRGQVWLTWQRQWMAGYF